MPQEIKKIDLDSTGGSLGTMKKKIFPWKFVLFPVGGLIILIVILGLLLLPIRGVMAKAGEVVKSGQRAAEALKNQDLVKTKEELAQTRNQLESLQREYGKVLGLKAIPVLGSYISDGEHGINAAFAGLSAADKAIEALEPNADLLGFKGKGRFVEGSADDRIQTAVKTMNVLVPKVNEMAVHVEVLRKELAQIDPTRYPAKIGKTVVRERLVSVKEVIENAANLFVNAQPLLINLPKMLGEPTQRRYLVLFQNDKELRSTGGFITAYAQFRLDGGKTILERADDIYALDNAKRKTFPAPREILTFHKNVYNLNIRDSNLSPDYKLSMEQFEKLYDSVSGAEAIDGIWAVDTHVLVEALKILGPITISGREFSAETDQRCDCPKAVYELEDYSSRPVGYVRDARKDIIGILLQQLLQKALGVSPSAYWGKLFQMLLSEINEKHVLAYFHDTDAQKAAESFNMAGRIMTSSESATLLAFKDGTGWDYLHINNSNMAGAKSNMFTSQKITKDVTVAGSTVTTKLTIEYKNPYPGSDCNLERGGLCLNAPLRNWLRVYVPKGSKLVEGKGAVSPNDNKPVPFDTYESLDKSVFEGFLIVNPLGTARIDITYTSSIESPGGTYRLLFQKQPGTDGDEAIIKLGGKERKKWVLKSDTEIVL